MLHTSRQPGAVLWVVVVLSFFQAQLPVLAGTFSDPFPVANAFAPFSAADLNNDGRADLLASTPGGTGIFLSTNPSPGAVAFERTAIVPGFGLPTPADLDNDGRLDLVFANPRSIQVFRNESAERLADTFTFAGQIMTNDTPVFIAPQGLIVTDLDGDDLPDLLTDYGPPILYLNSSQGGAITFADPRPLQLPIRVLDPIDLNGDGLPDFRSSEGGFLLNQSTPGNIAFVTNQTSTAPWIGTLDVDFTGDGLPDSRVVSPLWESSSRQMEIRQNLSSPAEIAFGPAFILPLGAGLFPRTEGYSYRFAELTGDGYTEILEVGPTAINVYLNASFDFGTHLHFEFTHGSPIPLPELTSPRLWADFNGDGKDDLLLYTRSGSPAIMLNQLANPETRLVLEIPQRTRRILADELVEVYGAASFAEPGSTLELSLRDGDLLLRTNAHQLAASFQFEPGLHTLDLRLVNEAGETILLESRELLVVSELNLMVQARALPPQGPSGSSYLLDVQDQLYVFGRNSFGQLGLGYLSPSEPLPVLAPLPEGVSGWETLSAGEHFALALSREGNLYAWGDNSSFQLGLAGVTNSPVPLPIDYFAPGETAGLSAGSSHVLLLTTSGEVFTWGANAEGQLGLGHTNATPAIHSCPPPEGLLWTDVAAGFSSSFARASDGQFYAWGWNRYGQLGLGHTNPVLVPTPLPNPPGEIFARIAPGHLHAVGLTESGKLYAWGPNGSPLYNNLLGLGAAATNYPSIIPTPVELPFQPGWAGISASPRGNIARTTDGKFYVWGTTTTFGILGPSSPIEVGTNLTWTSAVAASAHYLALAEDGSVYSWGHDGYGQLGQGGSHPLPLNPVPTRICSLDAVCPGKTNFPPTLQVEWPALGDRMPRSGQITLTPRVSDPDGFVDSVELYYLIPVRSFPFAQVNDYITNVIARATEEPFTLDLFPGGLFSRFGSSSIRVRATDNSGTSVHVNPPWFNLPEQSRAGWQGGQTNPITGFREYRLTLYSGSFQLDGIGVVINNLPPGVRVVNAASTHEGLPLLQHYFPLRTQSSVALTLELEGPLPENFIPQSTIVNFGADLPPPPPGELRSLCGIEKIPGGIALQATVDPGAAYIMEFSTNLVDWLAIPSRLEPADATLDWLDYGPPKTPASPVHGSRFYRLRQLQE